MPNPVKEQTEFAKELEAFKTKQRTDGELVVLNIFPEKVHELNQLLVDGTFDYARLPKIVQDVNIPKPNELLLDNNHAHPPAKRQKTSDNGAADLEGTKVITFVCGTVPCNSELAGLIEPVKAVLRGAVEDFNRVKLWILLLIPRMEDGNNFGVSIQEEVLSEVRTVEAEAATFLDQLSRYFHTRGKMVTKIARYPHVDDYRRAIQDLDEKQFINLRLVLLEMRNHYATLHDLIVKNLEKIRKPRNSNMEHLY